MSTIKSKIPQSPMPIKNKLNCLPMENLCGVKKDLQIQPNGLLLVNTTLMIIF